MDGPVIAVASVSASGRCGGRRGPGHRPDLRRAGGLRGRPAAGSALRGDPLDDAADSLRAWSRRRVGPDDQPDQRRGRCLVRLPSVPHSRCRRQGWLTAAMSSSAMPNRSAAAPIASGDAYLLVDVNRFDRSACRCLGGRRGEVSTSRRARCSSSKHLVHPTGTALTSVGVVAYFRRESIRWWLISVSLVGYAKLRGEGERVA